MSKNKYLSDEEKSLFRDAVSDVKPLSPQDEISPVAAKEPEPPAAQEIKITIKKTHAIKHEPPLFQSSEPQRTVYGDDIIGFAKPGLQHKRFMRLKQGKMKIEATLDLHEHTSDEALVAVDLFLERCQQRGMRSVCIIHGKGHFSSENTPVLKNLLNHYLREHPRITAFHSAKRTEGGTGAIYVLLKA